MFMLYYHTDISDKVMIKYIHFYKTCIYLIMSYCASHAKIFYHERRLGVYIVKYGKTFVLDQ